MGAKLIGKPERVIAVLAICLAIVITLLYIHTRERKLNGLLVDLELAAPDPSRHGQLQHVLTHELHEAPSLKKYHMTLNYVHFTELTTKDLDPGEVDFVILSPQSTPWYKYSGDAGQKLDLAKKLIRDIVLGGELPILGICGGHQFLAMAFGGCVDFIDPNFVGRYPDTYPKDAESERGEVVIHILRDDRIFSGLADKCDRFTAMENHYEEVKIVPEPFINLARSEVSEAQLIGIPEKPVYGMAFHPERCTGNANRQTAGECDGRRILTNFLKMACDKQR